MPPDAGQQSATEIRDNIPRVAGGTVDEMRTDDFKENGPDDQVQRDFSGGWKAIVLPQSQPALHEQQRRQSARHHQKIIEMKTQKRTVDVRPNQPAIRSVKRAGNQKQRIAKIGKPFHSSARIVQPKATASPNLKRRIMLYSASSWETRQNFSMCVEYPDSSQEKTR